MQADERYIPSPDSWKIDLKATMSFLYSSLKLVSLSQSRQPGIITTVVYQNATR